MFCSPRESSHEDCLGLRLPGGDGVRLLGECWAAGGPPGLAGAGAGHVPTQPFPQVKSWLRRAKSDDSEENAVESFPTLCAQPHVVLALRMRMFRSVLYPSPQTDGIYPLLLPAGVQEQAPVLPVQICLCASPAATVPGGCFGGVADALPPTKCGDSGPNEMRARSAPCLPLACRAGLRQSHL